MNLGRIRYCQEYIVDMSDLQCLLPSHQPRVSDHMEQIKDMIAQVFYFSCYGAAFIWEMLRNASYEKKVEKCWSFSDIHIHKILISLSHACARARTQTHTRHWCCNAPRPLGLGSSIYLFRDTKNHKICQRI